MRVSLAALLLGAVLACCASATRAGEAAGRILIAVGDVSIVRGAQRIAARDGMPVLSGDTLELGPRSEAQLLFTDHSIVVLGPETTFRIADYHFGGRGASDERAFYELLKGGLRTLTGIIGHLHRKDYRLETHSATIGILGTYFSVVVCSDNCWNADGTLAPNGTYGAVSAGRVAVANETGERDFAAGEFFTVASQLARPRQLLAPPPFLVDALEGLGRAASNARNGATQGSGSPAAGSIGSPTSSVAPSTGSNAPGTPATTPVAPLPSVTGQGAQSGAPSPATPQPTGMSAASPSASPPASAPPLPSTPAPNLPGQVPASPISPPAQVNPHASSMPAPTIGPQAPSAPPSVLSPQAPASPIAQPAQLIPPVPALPAPAIGPQLPSAPPSALLPQAPTTPIAPPAQVSPPTPALPAPAIGPQVPSAPPPALLPQAPASPIVQPAQVSSPAIGPRSLPVPEPALLQQAPAIPPPQPVQSILQAPSPTLPSVTPIERK